MSNDTLDYVRDHMDSEELLFRAVWNGIKALITVTPILVAVFVLVNVRSIISPGAEYVVIYAGLFAVSLVAIIAANIKLYHSEGWLPLKYWLFSKFVRVDDLVIASGASWIGSFFAVMAIYYFTDLFRFVLQGLIILTPVSAIPIVAFLYMFQKYSLYDSLYERIVVSVVYGYLSGIGLKLFGILLVLSVDIIGVPLTVIGLILEVVIAAFYSYLDLSQWVEEERERAISLAQFEESARIVEMMKDIAQRAGRYHR